MTRFDPQVMAKRKARRDRANRIFTGVCWSAASVSVIVLGVLLFSIISQGIRYLDFGFLSGLPSRNADEAGMWPPIAGSVVICGICALTALPLGVGSAIFLEEYRPKAEWARKIHGFIQLNISNLAGVPSIVYGIIGLTVFVQMFNLLGSTKDPAFEVGVEFYDQVADEAGNYLIFPRDSRDQPFVDLEGGMQAKTDLSETVTVNVVTNEQRNELYDKVDAAVAALPEDLSDEESEERRDAIEARYLSGVVPEDAYIDRVAEQKWWYFRIPFGRGVLAGGFTLMLVILPIVIVSSQEALRSVPPSLREGAFGLGATKWQSVRRIVLPAAIPGIMTGSILALSRAIGEAAPILILAGIVYITFVPQNLMDDFTAMPLQIYHWAGLPQKDFHQVAASGIIVLLAILLSFNAVAVFIRHKLQKPLQ